MQHFNIASYIDHTILKPDTTKANVIQLCTEAANMKFAAVCIPPFYVPVASDILRGTDIKVATVVGFPFGYSTTVTKLQEIQEAIAAGAQEIDIVHNIAALKNGDWKYTTQEIDATTRLTHSNNCAIKIIVESGLLIDNELIKCCEVYGDLNIDFLKTSTGYSATGATVYAVKLIREHLPPHISIKASGGIRTFAFAKELIDAGATRIGCSSSLQIVKESNE